MRKSNIVWEEEKKETFQTWIFSIYQWDEQDKAEDILNQLNLNSFDFDFIVYCFSIQMTKN